VKKQDFRVLVWLIASIVISSCTPSPRSNNVSDLSQIVHPVYFPTPSTIPTINSHDLNYLNWVNKYPNTLHHSVKVSPNGLIVSSRPDPFELGKDHIEISFEKDKYRIIELSIDNSFLELPPDAVSDGKINLYSGSPRSGDNTTWSPDSTAVLVMGAAFLGPDFAFLIIIDISDPENVDKNVVKWDYEGEPYTAWSPDSSQLLLWFGPEINLGKMFTVSYTERAWILDRQGTRLSEFDIKGFRSPFWVGDQLFAIKNENEIWLISPDQNHAEKLFTNDKPIAKILDRSHQNTQLLLIEDVSPHDLLLYDIDLNLVVDRIPSQLKYYSPGQVDDCHVIRTNSHYTGIEFISIVVFDWTTHTVIKYTDFINDIFWSPVVKGFIGNRFHPPDKLDIIYP
jgi:hypothetical protein